MGVSRSVPPLYSKRPCSTDPLTCGLARLFVAHLGNSITDLGNYTERLTSLGLTPNVAEVSKVARTEN